MSNDIIERIEALRASLSEIQERVGGVLERSASSRRYEDFVRSSTDWVWETDANLNFVFVSDGIAGVFGVPARALEGRYLFSLSHFRSPDEVLLDVVDMIENRRPFRNVALELIDADGEPKKILLSGVPIFDSTTERFTGYRGAGVDLAANRSATPLDAARAGKFADDRLAQAIEAGHVGVWDWTLASDAIYVAPNLAQMLGYDDGSFGDDINEWRRHIHPDDRARVRRTIDEHLEGRTPEFELEHRMLHRDGSVLWFIFRGRSVRGSSGEPVRVAGTATDITELKRLEAELRSATEAAELANRAKTDFLAHLSHELRTPLNAIIGFSEAIKDGYFGPLSVEKSREYASDVYVASTHLLGLINDVLDLSKVEAGQVELIEETLDVADIVGSSVRLARGQATTEGLRLNVRIADSVPGLRADARLVRQVLLNLLTNAIKFTGQGGDITVGAWARDDGGVTLRVADTGIGMDEDDIPKALEPFAQVDHDEVRRAKGTGLGLPLSKSLVELHGGTLSVRSKRGEGTQVTVDFPAWRSVR